MPISLLFDLLDIGHNLFRAYVTPRLVGKSWIDRILKEGREDILRIFSIIPHINSYYQVTEAPDIPSLVRHILGNGSQLSMVLCGEP